VAASTLIVKQLPASRPHAGCDGFGGCRCGTSLLQEVLGLFACVYVLIHGRMTAGLIAIPPRPGLASGCSDAELLTIVVVRHLLGRRSEAAFLA
jgi:hypothetical protein